MSNHDRLLKSIDTYIQKDLDERRTLLETEGFLDADATIEEIEALEEELAEIFEEEKRSYIQDILRYHDLRAYREQGLRESRENERASGLLAGLFADQFIAILPALTKAYVQQADPELKAQEVTRRSQDSDDQWARELGTILTDSASSEIERMVDAAIRDDMSVQEFVTELQDREEYTRANDVATTEILRLHSVAQEEAMIQNSAITGRRWVHNPSKYPREHHRDMDGKIALDGEPFELTGADEHVYYPMMPRDPSLPVSESIHCHCTTRPVTSDEILALPLLERERMQREAIEEVDEYWTERVDRERSRTAGLA